MTGALSPRTRLLLTAAGALVVCGLLARALAGRGADFATALHGAPAATLVGAVSLQIVALIARSEAWNVCVSAAGGRVGRRRLFRAASLGYVGNLVNGQFGVAARIAALRRSAPQDSPPVAALIGAELPILTVEAGLAALTSFTLVGPLGLPWWSPLPGLAVVGLIGALLARLAQRQGRSLWRGLSVMRSARGEVRLVGIVLVAVLAQIARNWIVLQALGVNASVFDSIAVLIAMVTLSQLPIGPSVGAAATVAVLGPTGVATAAAAGVLLTATGTAGALLYAGWAGLDALFVHRILAGYGLRRRRSVMRGSGALGRLPGRQRRTVEVAYFGGLTVSEIARLVWLPVRLGAPHAAVTAA